MGICFVVRKQKHAANKPVCGVKKFKEKPYFITERPVQIPTSARNEMKVLFASFSFKKKKRKRS